MDKGTVVGSTFVSVVMDKGSTFVSVVMDKGSTFVAVVVPLLYQ